MEFWGIEVKPGETVKCEPGDDKYLHLSQASLGEAKKEKGNESVPVYVKFDNQQLVIGTLSADKCPQIQYDLVFEKEFELSHSWKTGSVFFVGYKTEIPYDRPEELLEDYSGSEEDTPVKKEANGKPKDELAKTKANALKADSMAAKPSVKAEEVKKAKKEDEEDDSDEDEDESDEDESDDEDMLDGEDDSGDEVEDDDEDESSEEDASPKKGEIGKKRAADSALKTPAPDKKAKLAMPVGGQKTGGTDGKKGGHTATPHPAKQAGKTAATNDKSKQQPPKSPGSVSCKSCSKTFKDDHALQAHTKAKHASK